MHQQDVEQGAQERALAQQMRSVRRRWIHFVFRRTVLLLMVPFGAVLVLSIYFYLLSLDNVITALWITCLISWVLIIYAHLTSVSQLVSHFPFNCPTQLDFIQSDHRTVLNSLFLLIVFYWPLCLPILLLRYALEDHPYTVVVIILCHHFAVFFLTDHGPASTLLALVITVIYLFVLVNVVVVKRGWPFFVVEVKPYYESFV